MKKIYGWFRKLPKQIQDSIFFSITIIGFISTIFTILGISLNDITTIAIWIRIFAVFAFAILLMFGCYLAIGKIYKESVTLTIAHTPIEISCGDIFKTPGLKVIGCDNHFDTRIDDIVISKKSLHGKLVLEHGDINAIREKVEEVAIKEGLKKDSDGLYNFPLGTIIRYDSSIDGQTYLMLAMAELNDKYEVHTNMSKYELMLMKMWKEISRVYASYDVVLPILGAGISRFDDGPKSKDALLRCMLCTFNSSGVKLNSKIKIVIYGSTEEFHLYEYKDIFSGILKN